MARKKKPLTGQSDSPPAAKKTSEVGDMDAVTGSEEKSGKGSQHRPRVMMALRPAVYDLLVTYSKRQRRAASWELHNILLQHFVREKLITQDEADVLWDDVIRRKADE